MGIGGPNIILATSILSKLSKLPSSSQKRCIYRIPEPLRAVKKEAYTPFMVSIGPYHHKDPKLLPMETHKLKYLNTFLHNPESSENIHTYLKYIRDNESLIRESYADPIPELSPNDFIELVLVDSVFIIELFRRASKNCRVEEGDFLFSRPCLINYIRRDIGLAENQLPFFVINDLYTKAFRPDVNGSVPYFTEIAWKFSKVTGSRIRNYADTHGADCCHLLDLLRNRYLQATPREKVIDSGNTDPLKKIVCPSVTHLWEAGVKFQVAQVNTNRLLDIHFDEVKAVLTIPKMVVSDNTELERRNMIAFEQCHHQNNTRISDYQFLMDCLINTAKDVKVLVEAGIIENWVGSDEEVSDLFNNLSMQVNINCKNHYYASIMTQLNAHCDRRWNFYRATLKHNYFNHPWAAVSVIYAAVLLVLTIVQAVTGILPVLRC